MTNRKARRARRPVGARSDLPATGHAVGVGVEVCRDANVATSVSRDVEHAVRVLVRSPRIERGAFAYLAKPATTEVSAARSSPPTTSATNTSTRVKPAFLIVAAVPSNAEAGQ